MFSVDNSDPLERTLKRFDNAASYFKSTFKNTPEQLMYCLEVKKELEQEQEK